MREAVWSIVYVFMYFTIPLHGARAAMAAGVSIFPPLTISRTSQTGAPCSPSPHICQKRATKGKTKENEKPKQNRLFDPPRPPTPLTPLRQTRTSRPPSRPSPPFPGRSGSRPREGLGSLLTLWALRSPIRAVPVMPTPLWSIVCVLHLFGAICGWPDIRGWSDIRGWPDDGGPSADGLAATHNPFTDHARYTVILPAPQIDLCMK